MLAAAYAYRDARPHPRPQGSARRLPGPLRHPRQRRRCITHPRCYNNLKLVDARRGARHHRRRRSASADPAGAARQPARRARGRRRGSSTGASRGRRLRRPRADRGRRRSRGTVLSDPPADPTAYHALSTFMLEQAVRAARCRGLAPPRLRARREALDALALLVAPAGDASYLGRGQDQVWVPAITAAALAAGARTRSPRPGAPALPRRRRAALRRLDGSTHARPAASTRPRRAPPYDDRRDRPLRPHGRLQRPRAVRARPPRCDALAAIPGRAGRKPPAGRRALSAAGRARRDRPRRRRGRPHLDGRPRDPPQHERPAPRLRPTRARSAARPRLARPARPAPAHGGHPGDGGPALMRDGDRHRADRLRLRVRAGRVRFTADYRERGELVRRVTLTYALTRRGARLALRGAEPRRRASACSRSRRPAPAAAGGAGSTPPAPAGVSTARSRSAASRATTRHRWSSSTRSRRVVTAPRSGRFALSIGSAVR